MKRDALDADFSKLIRCRPNWRCESCDKKFNPLEPRGTMGLDCSHFFTRTRRSTRWHPMAAAAHCAKCHFDLGHNPMEFARWIKRYLGAERALLMEQRSNMIVRWRKPELAIIRNQLKDEWKKMQRMRDNGFEGWIEFTVPFVEDI